VKKIQIHTGIVDLNYPVPYSLSYVLGDPLVIPPSRATQVPLGMVAEEIILDVKFQISSAFANACRPATSDKNSRSQKRSVTGDS